MAWQDYADKSGVAPVVLVEIDFDSGKRYYGTRFTPTATQMYKGNVLSLPILAVSIGDVKRTYERDDISIVFNDSDYEFRGLEESEAVSFLGREVVIKVAFREDDCAAPLTLYTGLIYDWRRLDNLQYELRVREKSYDLDAKYPQKKVTLTDYANAHSNAVGQIIPIPYGTISALGLSGDGAFPALFVDTTQDAEIHLVGLQTAAITVPRVYLDGVLQTEGAGNDYQVASAVIDGFTHTTIEWEAGVRPTESSVVTCDITFGSRRPVEAIEHFLENFTPFSAGDFNAVAFASEKALETDRGYTFDGAITKEETLRTHLDNWRDEFELDIYWNTAGEVMFRYMSAMTSAGATVYKDFLDILAGDFESDPQVRELINEIEYGYNYNYAKDYYFNYGTAENAESQTKHGGTYRGEFQNLKWCRSATMASDIISRKILRFKDPVTFDQLTLNLRSFSEDLADAVKITHFLGVGASGYSERVFQIRARGLNLDVFTNQLLLEDTSAYMGRFCRLGDRDTLAATWLLATSAEKDYLFLCDDTVDPGVFSNGDEGKQAFD